MDKMSDNHAQSIFTVLTFMTSRNILGSSLHIKILLAV